MMTVVALTTATANDARLEAELADRLGTHQRDDGEGSALHLDLGHHLVRGHLGDQSDEPVTRRTGDAERVRRRGGVIAGELGEHLSRDHLAARLVLVRGRLPPSIQRRTVSSLTPRSTAASLIRMAGTPRPLWLV